MNKLPRRIMPTVALILMILGAIVMVYPYAYMVGSSLKTRSEFARDKHSLIPPRYQIGEQLRHARGQSSALDWPGADWSMLRKASPSSLRSFSCKPSSV